MSYIAVNFYPRQTPSLCAVHRLRMNSSSHHNCSDDRQVLRVARDDNGQESRSEDKINDGTRRFTHLRAA